MRQLTLDPTTGSVSLQEVELPAPARGQALVRVGWSVISTGTELSKIDLAKKTLWEKARSRPDQVAKVIQSAAAEGRGERSKARERPSTPMPLGYSLSGCRGMREDTGGLSVGIPSPAPAQSPLTPNSLCSATLAVPIPPGVRRACRLRPSARSRCMASAPGSTLAIAL